jgi:general secretion pathway protein E
VLSFPEALLRRVQAVPLTRPGAETYVALADPTDGDAIAELEHAAGTPISLGVTTPSMIRHVLDAVFGVKREEWRPDHDRTPTSGAHYDVVWDRSGMMFLQFHLSTAFAQGASEIHFVPDKTLLRVLYRLGANLTQIASESIEVGSYLSARLEALSGLVLHDGEAHAYGRAVCPMGGEEVLMDVSLVRGSDGTAITLVPQKRTPQAPSLDELGIENTDAARLRAMLYHPAGIVLVCAPRRSGGSTTLRSLLGCVDVSRRRLLAFDTRAGQTIPSATIVPLSGPGATGQWEEIAVAQGADVVVLDDVLSGPAVAGALAAGAAGRLLLVKTDWADTFILLDHLLERRELRHLVANRLLAVIQQRLARVEKPDLARPRAGFPLGQEALFEILFVSEPMRQAMRAGEGAEPVREVALAEGFRTLSDEARRRVGEGSLTAAEAARALT